MSVLGHDTQPDLYFGSDTEQAKIIADLEKSIASDSSKLHMVCGGTGVGKTSVLQTVAENMQRNKQFTRVVNADDMDDDFTIPSGKVPDRMCVLLEKLHDENAGLYVQHHVYKHKDKPLYVVIADGETSPSIDGVTGNIGWIMNIAETVRDAKKEGYEVVWVADAPIAHQAASIFKPSSAAGKYAQQHDAGVKRLEKDYKGVVTTHTLHYDAANIREALWKGISEGKQEFLTYLQKTGHWDKTAEWKKTADAALAGDREAYDKAFNTLAKRARVSAVSAA